LCDFEPRCPIRSNQQIISKAVSGALERLMLSDLVQPLELAAIKDTQGKLITIGPLSGRMQ
jgi:DNA-binding IscR family transcriptional regulator